MTFNAQSYYSDCLKRVTHEYDQRDRDFLMHTTVAAALFAAVGFLTQVLKRDLPITWVLFGLTTIGVAFIGIKSSSALKDSVRSFSYWQKFIERHLAETEAIFLPAGFGGLYGSASRLPHQPKNVTEARQAMADTLHIVWQVIAVLSVLPITFGITSALWPAVKNSIQSHF